MGDSLLDRAGLAQAVSILKAAKRVLICTHARPDGDALGSELALGRLLAGQGKDVDLVVEAGAPADLTFLPGSARIGGTAAAVRPPYDWMVVVDAAGIERIEGMQKAIPPGQRILNIDHHASNTRFGHQNWVEPESASVGEMIYVLAREAGWPIDRDAAVCLYVAVITDTGRFAFSSTRPSTHLMAAELLKLGVQPGEINRQIWGSKSLGELKLHGETIRSIRTAEKGRIAWAALTQEMFDASGVVPLESQDYVTLVKSVKGVEVAILLRPLSDREIKISLRTESSADASAICALFGGGGHKRAAGATLRMSMDDAVKAVVAAAAEELKKGKVS